MEDDLPEGGRDRRLNRLVAMTVVILSVFMAVANIKDDNLVQAMQLAKSDAINTWSEYQATRTKAHIVATARAEMTLIAGATPSAPARTALVSMDAEAAKYAAETPRLKAKAEADDAQYDALNMHDDQFDMCDALISACHLGPITTLASSFFRGYFFLSLWSRSLPFHLFHCFALLVLVTFLLFVFARLCRSPRSPCSSFSLFSRSLVLDLPLCFFLISRSCHSCFMILFLLSSL